MPPIITSDHDGVRTITLDRPDVRNALSRSLLHALQEAFDEAAARPEVRAVVLTGAGSAFCAGLDLAELEGLASRGAEEHRRDAATLGRLLLRVVTLDKPVIAAVNGAAVAGGAGLASACDVVIADEGARIGYTEARIGFVAALVGVLLVRQVGDRVARDLLLSARLVDAREAARLGLVNEVATAGGAPARAREIAAAMARNAPSSLAMTKSLLATVPSMSLEDGMRLAVEMNALARQTDDLREGVRAFFEKRAPRWVDTT